MTILREISRRIRFKEEGRSGPVGRQRSALGPRLTGDTQPFGFRLNGPFDLRSGGSMPKLRVAYTPPALTKGDRERLQDAVRSSRIEVVTGRKDKLLRSVHFTADLGFDVPPDLRAALGRLVGAKLELELKLANPQTA